MLNTAKCEVDEVFRPYLLCSENIRKEDGNAKVVMCSAMGQQNMVIEAIQSGARDFIVKPFQPDRVLEAIKKVIG